MVMAAPIFHGTGLSQFTLGLALGNRVIFQQRRFDPELTLANIVKHRADSLVVVPTMLQRMLDLPADVLAKYDMTPLKVIFAAARRFRRTSWCAPPNTSATCSTTCTAPPNAR